VSNSLRTENRRERILLADDEEMVRKAIRLILAGCGYQITEAVDGEDAVEKYTHTSPSFDLVLLDLDMPRLNGLDALERIRKHHSAARVILLSGGAHSLEASQITFVQKPFDNAELIKRVRETLDFESKKR
jgi:two-component system, cell cycle sensor histidine kinase and response regulator CckA